MSDQFPKHAQSSAPFFYTGYETFTSHFSTSLKDRGYRYGTRHAYGSALSCNLRWHTQESPRTQTINRVTEDAFLEHLPECGCSVQQESISQRYPPPKFWSDSSPVKLATQPGPLLFQGQERRIYCLFGTLLMANTLNFSLCDM